MPTNNLKHGHANGGIVTAEYRTWTNMRSRCSDSKRVDWHRYGGRGIKVCARWSDFIMFLCNMGMRPSRQHSLERINNDGDYGPPNCRWATVSEQARNRKTNRIVRFMGKDMTFSEACCRAGIKKTTVHQRLTRGWTIERALGESLWL